MESRRGLVLEIKKGRATLLGPGGEFRAAAVPRGARWVVGQEVRLDHLMAARGVWRGWVSARPAVAALALMVALVAVGLPVAGHIYSRPLTTVAYLSVDINPSFEVGIDTRGRTSSVTALNADAAKLILGRSFSGPVRKVVSQLVDMAVGAGYLGTPDGLVLITTSPAPPATVNAQGNTAAATGKAVAEKVLADTKASVEATLAKANKTNAVQSLKVDADTREEAKNEGLSQGKFAILLAAQGENLAVSVDDMKTGSVAQVIKKAGGKVGEVMGKASEVKDFHPLIQEFHDKAKGSDKDRVKDQDTDKDTDKDSGRDNGKEKDKAGQQGQVTMPAITPAGPTKPEGDQDKGKGTNPGGESPSKGTTVGMGTAPGQSPTVAPGLPGAGLPGAGPPGGQGQAVGDGHGNQGESRAGKPGYAPLPETGAGVGGAGAGNGSKAKDTWISTFAGETDAKDQSPQDTGGQNSRGDRHTTAVQGSSDGSSGTDQGGPSVTDPGGTKQPGNEKKPDRDTKSADKDEGRGGKPDTKNDHKEQGKGR